MADVSLFIVEAQGGLFPDEPATVCEFPAIETAHTFRWSQQYRHEVGLNITGGRCDKERMTSGLGIRVYRTRAEAVKAYKAKLAQRIVELKAELTRFQALKKLGVPPCR